MVLIGIKREIEELNRRPEPVEGRLKVCAYLWSALRQARGHGVEVDRQLRIIFMGTPDFAVPTLNALVEAGHEVVAVYSQPPRPANRGKKLMRGAVQQRAEELGLEVRTPLSLRSAEEQMAFAALNADVAVVAAYGLILPQPILDAPEHGCLNVHGSLLPRWRGAAPVQRAILAGDAETGVCIMQMETGLDTGPVRATGRTAVEGKTAGELTAELAKLGARLMVEVLADLAYHTAIAQPDNGVTYASKIDKSEARLHFDQSATAVERQVRAFNPLPGAFFEFAGERYRVLAADIVALAEAGATGSLKQTSNGPSLRGGNVLDDRLTIACATGAIRPAIIQRAGKPAMPLADFLRGNAIPPGKILS
jgi:methionyl-tRNA formyltransferase